MLNTESVPSKISDKPFINQREEFTENLEFTDAKFLL
jgi:hypothetical protein